MRNGLIITENGTKSWYQNGELHREDGPAVEWTDGTKEWYQNNQRHRIDGPAVEHSSSTKLWFIKGDIYSFNQWLEHTDYTEAQKTLMRLQHA